jgi:hypothetical protein
LDVAHILVTGNRSDFEDRWRMNLMNLAGDSIALSASWSREDDASTNAAQLKQPAFAHGALTIDALRKSGGWTPTSCP